MEKNLVHTLYTHIEELYYIVFQCIYNIYVRRCSYTYVNISIFIYTDTFAFSPLIEIKYLSVVKITLA